MVIGKLGEYPARRLDFLYTSPEEYPFAVLYFTGSKGFNTAMRQRALDLGYSLNVTRYSRIEARF
jgi:DNA polymerase IV (family X)